MKETVIKVEHLSKMYQLGEVGTGTISHDLNRWWARMRGKEDPYGKIVEVNDRTVKGVSDYVWALNDINFEVKQGQVLGVIGRNGAGKSTLLKILSKVTKPTKGHVHIKGRIAALLEVGTGFHPELTGRENIFLNGSILGMTKAEIRLKFDAIVDFSGISRYIDTPVKRYSSGMYVRLAFAVAAFLEPEILIVDEVLAVGDLEFQKQCLGRMKEVSEGEGRTVLFVSHNLNSIKSLCENSLLLANGTVAAYGRSSEIISSYVEKLLTSQGEFIINQTGSKPILIKSVCLYTNNGERTSQIKYGDSLKIEIRFISQETVKNPNVWIELQHQGIGITGATNMQDGLRPKVFAPGENTVCCTFNSLRLMPGKTYTVHMGVRDSSGHSPIATSEDVAVFKVEGKLSDYGFDGSLADTIGKDFTPPFVPYSWEHNGELVGTFKTIYAE
jgi:lipopolysaccharide transport system ATP-binding protein